MVSPIDEEKPWKRDLARTSALRREQVAKDIEELVKRASSFEEALKVAVETMKRKFARFSAVTAYVADGEDLAVHTTLDRPAGPDRVWSGGGPLAAAAQATTATVVADLSRDVAWGGVGLSTGSVMVAPIRTEAGLWAIVEVWSDFREAFTAQDQRMLERVTGALAHKTPSA